MDKPTIRSVVQPVERETLLNFRSSLLALLWKIVLGSAVLDAILVVTIQGSSPEWFSMPALWLVAAGLTWVFLRRGRYFWAAWSFVLINGMAVAMPLLLIVPGDLTDAFSDTAWKSLPFAFTLLVSLAGLLLPPWSTWILLGIQFVATVLTPFWIGQAASSLSWVALSFTGISIGLAYASSGPLFGMVNWALENYRRTEQRAEELALNRAELHKSLTAQDTLNRQLSESNAELVRRSVELQSAAQVSQAIISATSVPDLAGRVVQLLSLGFKAQAMLFLIDEAGEWITLEASSSTAIGKDYRVRVEDPSLLSGCIAHARPQLARLGELSLAGHVLPETHSEMALPLMSQGQAIGALDLQSGDAQALGEPDMPILQAIADQIVSGIVNIRSLENTRLTLQDLEQVRQRYVRESWDRLAPRLQAAGYRWQGGNILPLEHRPLPEVEQVIENEQAVVEQGNVVVPISYGGHVLGVLGVNDPSSGERWSGDALALIQSVANQMGQALENARLFEAAQERLAEITALQQSLLRESWEGYLSAKREREFVFRQPGVPSLTGFPPEADEVVEKKSPLSWVRDGDGGSETGYVAPIDRRGQIIGMLGLQEVGVKREWNQEELEIIDAVTAQLSSAVENAQLFEEVQRRAAEIERVAEQLREIDQFRADFLATMSHELRTPLNSIIGFSRVMLKGIDGPLNDLQKTDLEAIYNNGQHLLTLINDILDQSKIDAGKMELLLENDVSLGDILQKEMQSTLLVQIKERPVEPILEVAPELPLVRADSTRIRQVVRNLMSNAIKFTEKGSITVRAWHEEDLVYVSVKDTGIGISQDKISLVFEKFRQVDSSSTRAAQGTGLGMPISRTLVEMHGGRIWVESELGVGTTFTFYLPVEGPMADKIPELADWVADKIKRAVLVIEHSADESTTYHRVLDSLGYELVDLYNPPEALRWARYLNPFAIILDVQLEGEQGWQLLESFRATRHTRQTPVVVCSRLDEGTRAISTGATAFLRKPIIAKEMIEVFNRLTK